MGKGERTRAASLFDADPARAYRRSASLLLREEFLGMLFGLAFLGVGKARVRSGIARTERLVIAGHSRSKNGVASLAYDPAIHGASQNAHWSRPFSMDHRVKPGGDEEREARPR
jgi:hypothetical protein